MLIPDPAILSQPWFEAFLANGSPETKTDDSTGPVQPIPASTLPLISPKDLARLKRYAQLIQGTLMHQGEMIFPGQNGKPAQKLELSKTPVLVDKNGQKRLILPPTAELTEMNPDLLEGMKAFWKEIQVQEFNSAMERSFTLFKPSQSMDDIPKDPKGLIRQLLADTPFSYQNPAPVPVQIGNVSIDVTLARIISEKHPDLLINQGEVYGAALTAIKKRGWEILTLEPKMSYGEITLLFLSKLGYTTWETPSFNHDGKVKQLKGIYAVMGKDKRFITRQKLSPQEVDFLASQSIMQLILKEPNE